jgi:hypothetical protein
LRLDYLSDTVFVSLVHQRCGTQIAFALGALLCQNVAAVRFSALYLARAGKLESLLRSGLSFHLGHVLVLLSIQYKKYSLEIYENL